MADALHDLLNGYSYEALLQIAEFNGLPTTTSRGQRQKKVVLIELLCEHLFARQRVTKVIATLTPLERAVLDHLLLYPGDIPTSVLREELQREGIIPSAPRTEPTSKERKRRTEFYEADVLGPEKGPFEDVLARLTLHGLVFSSGQPSPWEFSTKLGLEPGQLLIVPEALRKLLPKPTLPSIEWGRGNLPAPIEENSTVMAQRDLFIYWSYVHAQPVALTQTGLVQKRALRSINEQLLFSDHSLAAIANERDSPRLYFLRLLLQELGLVTSERGQLRSPGPRNRVPEFWMQSVSERTKTCLTAWVRMKEWSELPDPNAATLSFDLPQARNVLLDQLRLLSPGVWFSAERFLNRLAVVAPRLLFQSRGPSTPSSSRWSALYYPDASYAPRQSQWFAEIQAAFVGGALSGPLHWLGLLDISADEGRLLAFRINPGGAQALGLNAIPAEDLGEAQVIVQPNFQILALGPVSEAILASLELFADRVKADRSAFEYLLSRTAVYRAQKDGLPVPMIIAFLEKNCSTPLPQNVLRTLQEWGEQHERIVLHRDVALCQTANAELLAQLHSDQELHKHLERMLTPTVAVVRRGHLAALQEALLQQEILPAFSPQDAPCTGRVQATAEGELQPLHTGPDLLLEARLRALAEEREGKYYVTETAVTKALAADMSVSQYLEQLAVLHRGPLPPDLQSRIKAWGHYYGKASLQKAVLLEVKDLATAEELLADNELAAFLKRFPGDPSGKLLLVQTDNLEKLRYLLHERGVELS